MQLEFHHINVVGDDIDRLHNFYTKVLGLADMSVEMFSRTEAQAGAGYDGDIKFATDGGMQMHPAQRDLTVAFRNGQSLNPVARGHIAFRTDNFGPSFGRARSVGYTLCRLRHRVLGRMAPSLFPRPRRKCHRGPSAGR